LVDATEAAIAGGYVAALPPKPKLERKTRGSPKAQVPAPRARAEHGSAGKPTHTDPREWKKPAIRNDEPKKAFEERLRNWERTRTTVAKRLGVSLTGVPTKGGAAKQ
jgi:hypothetical protein